MSASPGTVDLALAPCADGTEADRRACYATELAALVEGADDPRPVVLEIADAAWRAGDLLLASCHGLMHTVGREYTATHPVSLETLMDYLPANNDPGCTAGFSHGLLTGIAPQMDLSRPAEAAARCAAAGTRYREYSCIHGFGHAFMRLVDEDLEPALRLCALLGEAAVVDCAQGAYHDYWFAAIGADETVPPPRVVSNPRELCLDQPVRFVRACWYRAFVDTREAGFTVGHPDEIDRLCRDLTGLQRAGCVTAASVVGPADPASQLALCSDLVGEDAVACIRGVKAQNLLHEPPAALVDLLGRCSLFSGSGDAERFCYEWLGKVINVITDGAFETTGCPQLTTPAARAACAAGARSMGGPLETFS